MGEEIFESVNFDDLLETPTITEPTTPPESEEPEHQEPEGNEEPQKIDTEEPTKSVEQEDSDNSIYQFLKERGIVDPKTIQITNEDGSTEEVDFNSLSTEEQLEVLRYVTDPGLSEEEIDTINYLRRNQTNLQGVIDYFAEKKLQDYLNEHPEAVHQKKYEIDDYTDDDLFTIDLKNRYPNLTDEEIVAELDTAKQNEDLFKKKTETLRTAFKEQEDQAEQLRIQEEQQQVEDLRNNLMNAASNFNEIQLDYTDDTSDSLTVDDEDKQQMMSYILDQDAEGKSQLVKDLEDPNTLIQLAWYATQGARAFSELTKYWKGLLSESRNNIKKLEAKLEKANLEKANKNNTVVVPPSTKNNIESKSEYGSAWDNSGLI